VETRTATAPRSDSPRNYSGHDHCRGYRFCKFRRKELRRLARHYFRYRSPSDARFESPFNATGSSGGKSRSGPRIRFTRNFNFTTQAVEQGECFLSPAPYRSKQKGRAEARPSSINPLRESALRASAPADAETRECLAAAAGNPADDHARVHDSAHAHLNGSAPDRALRHLPPRAAAAATDYR